MGRHSLTLGIEGEAAILHDALREDTEVAVRGKRHRYLRKNGRELRLLSRQLINLLGWPDDALRQYEDDVLKANV